MANGFTKLAVTLAGVALLLLLYTTTLPQYGDGAIGTVLVFMAAVAVYVVVLAIAAPLAIRAAVRGEKIVEGGYFAFAVIAPLAAGTLVVLFSNFLT